MDFFASWRLVETSCEAKLLQCPTLPNTLLMTVNNTSNAGREV